MKFHAYMKFSSVSTTPFTVEVIIIRILKTFSVLLKEMPTQYALIHENYSLSSIWISCGGSTWKQPIDEWGRKRTFISFESPEPFPGFQSCSHFFLASSWLDKRPTVAPSVRTRVVVALGRVVICECHFSRLPKSHTRSIFCQMRHLSWFYDRVITKL